MEINNTQEKQIILTVVSPEKEDKVNNKINWWLMPIAGLFIFLYFVCKFMFMILEFLPAVLFDLGLYLMYGEKK